MLEKLLERLMRRAAKLSGSLADGGEGGPPAPALDPAVEAADRLIAQGNERESAGDPAEACALYRRALLAAPQYAKAHLNLGIGLEAQGDHEGAARSYERALAIDPADPYARYNLGKLLLLGGKLDEAERHLRGALIAKPDFADARVVVADLLDARGDAAAALAELETALAQRPDYGGALFNYARLLSKCGRRAEAEAALRRLLAREPRYPSASFHLGTLLAMRGEPAEAEAALRRAVEESDDFPEAHVGLYDVYRAQGRFDLALAQVERALELRPGWAHLWFFRGVMLNRMHRDAEGEAALRRAIELEPRLSEAHRILGTGLLGQLRFSEALRAYEAGRAYDADGYIRAAELVALNFSDEISSGQLFERHREFGRDIEQKYPPLVARFANDRDPDRKLRIGYVSADFHYHAVSTFLLPLLERHDRSAFEIHCYSLSDVVDDVTRRIIDSVDVWHSDLFLPRAELAARINRDGIDVLVDLTGHSSLPSFDVFARRPAPVQAAWLGYLCTTGLTRIDYRITDAWSDPPGTSERLHTETLLRLPRPQWCYRPFASGEASPSPPCMRNGFVTFGSFNYAAKLSRSARKLWSAILKRVPGSRLLALGVPEGRARETILRDLADDGVDAARVSFEPRMSLERYLARIGDVDIALDSTPYSGGTTTCDCLWMGAPVVALPGDRSVSRSAGSLLTAMGLSEWIARTPEDYVRIAAERAADAEALARLRGSLRSRMQASALMDETGFARDMESAYRQMWRTWCAASA